MNELRLLQPILLLDGLLLLGLILAAAFLFRRLQSMQQEQDARLQKALHDSEAAITEHVRKSIQDIRTDIAQRLQQDAEENRSNRKEVSGMLQAASTAQRQALSELAKEQGESLTGIQNTQNSNFSELNDRLEKRLSAMELSQTERLNRYQKEMDTVLRASISELQETNRKKLSDMQEEINKKLDTSLNERIDKSFESVGRQLNQLYQSLGELNKLESGVLSLNRTLSNVKTRGIYGESQLENILANILANTLYDKNVVTKKSSPSREAVEFAVKIPDKEVPGAFMYLPIDSKFPTSLYERIQEASERADAQALQHAVKDLEQHIKSEAKSIQEKYIDPPHTTDFAILFLPTEALYAEVLRIPGLSEEVQRSYHIVIAGPTTIAALLNSLSIGFRYMAVNRDSQNILKLLSAIKTQYAKLSQLIGTADSRIELAKKATTELQHRADIINRKLLSVEEIDASEAQALLGIHFDEDSDSP